MLQHLLSRIRAGLARALARLFYRVVDPQIEAELACPEEYIRMQQVRRMELERYLARYMGPRL